MRESANEVLFRSFSSDPKIGGTDLLAIEWIPSEPKSAISVGLPNDTYDYIYRSAKRSEVVTRVGNGSAYKILRQELGTRRHESLNHK